MFRESIRRLIHAAEQPTHARLWRAMSIEERGIALKHALREPDSGWLRSALVTLVARDMRFREKTVAAWSQEKLARAAARIDLGIGAAIESALIELHLEERSRMLGQFYGELGIPHEDGRVDVTSINLTPDDALRMRTAATGLLNAFPPDEVAIFLLALGVLQPASFGFLRSVLAEFSSEAERSPDDASPQGTVVSRGAGATGDRQEAPGAEAPRRGPFGFTTLDRRLITSIVDTAAGIEGAMSEDEIDDLIGEVVELNRSRHRSWFHAGYRDVLFERELEDHLPADNESRRLWYWAGVVSGLAREGRWDEIVRYFDEKPAVRVLGDRDEGPASAAAQLVFRALCEAGRVAHATAFATPVAIAASDALRREMLHQATKLVHFSRAADARPLLAALWGEEERVRQSGLGDRSDTSYHLELKRRWSLCLRQLGEEDRARRLLKELAVEMDHVTRVVALTDLGLLDGGFRRLGELTIPGDAQQRAAFLQALERGEPRFEEAARSPAFVPAHARFATGVIAMLRQDWRTAVAQLDPALSHFERSPDVYKEDGTLGLARLYLGVSLCHTLEDTGRLARAADLIRSGLREGARVPRDLVASTVEALGLARDDLALSVAGDMLDASGPEVLDDLVATEAGRASAAVRAALFKRAADPTRPHAVRAADYRTVLPMLQRDGDVDRARDALEYLAEQAAMGTGREEFLALLADPGNYDPAWSVDDAADARIQCLEAIGRLEDAAVEIQSTCYRVLATNSSHSLDLAELYLERVRGYGPRGADVARALESIIEARSAARDAEPPIVDNSGAAVHILVVGGNEVQEKMDEDIRRELAESHPNVTVDFLHTGWGSNWNVHASEFERRIARCDGVVFMRFMRTQLGRTIRPHCPVPWCGCGAGGRGAIIRSILHVVPFARAYIRERATTA